MNEVLTLLLGGGGLVATILGYIFGRKKANAEAEGAEIENLRKIIEQQQHQIDFLNGQIENLQNQILQLKGFPKNMNEKDERLDAPING